MRLVVIGAGDVGGRVAARWVQAGGEAIGITRGTQRHAELEAAGVQPTTADPSTVLRPTDHVLLSVSGGAGQTEAARALAGWQGPRAVMTSSTGFYGAQGGSLGAHSPAGSSDRAQAAALAEQTFLQHAPIGAAHVLRLGGLYRAGRGPQQALRRRGHAPAGPADRPLPLVHVDDAVTAILAALNGQTTARIVNVVVSPVPSRRAWYTLACELLDLPTPSFEGAAAERHFDTKTLQADLLPEPAWPDWQEGLRQAIAASQAS